MEISVEMKIKTPKGVKVFRGDMVEVVIEKSHPRKGARHSVGERPNLPMLIKGLTLLSIKKPEFLVSDVETYFKKNGFPKVGGQAFSNDFKQLVRDATVKVVGQKGKLKKYSLSF